MSAFTASIFATRLRANGDEHSLVAYALLFEGSRPCWEIHIGKKCFSFIPHPDHILEDGLWQLNDYCHIPELEYKSDPSNVAPLTLEEEFGADICNSSRNALQEELKISGLYFKLNTWPGVWMPNKERQIQDWQKAGVKIA